MVQGIQGLPSISVSPLHLGHLRCIGIGIGIAVVFFSN
jgi:hypothetical protein